MAPPSTVNTNQKVYKAPPLPCTSVWCFQILQVYTPQCLFCYWWLWLQDPLLGAQIGCAWVLPTLCQTDSPDLHAVLAFMLGWATIVAYWLVRPQECVTLWCSWRACPRSPKMAAGYNFRDMWSPCCFGCTKMTHFLAWDSYSWKPEQTVHWATTAGRPEQAVTMILLLSLSGLGSGTVP